MIGRSSEVFLSRNISCRAYPATSTNPYCRVVSLNYQRRYRQREHVRADTIGLISWGRSMHSSNKVFKIQAECRNTCESFATNMFAISPHRTPNLAVGFRIVHRRNYLIVFYSFARQMQWYFTRIIFFFIYCLLDLEIRLKLIGNWKHFEDEGFRSSHQNKAYGGGNRWCSTNRFGRAPRNFKMLSRT